MVSRIHLYFVVVLINVCVIAATTNSADEKALRSLKASWENVPPGWAGSDPCGNSWEGISCNMSRVVSIILTSMDLSGHLSSDISGLSELHTLDLSYNKRLSGTLPQSIGDLTKLTNLILVGCSFSGSIPDSIGSLRQLVYLSLNSNNFIGKIPGSIGLLSDLYWLDLADNKLDGTIPVSSGSAPGLDMLHKTKHFHLSKNQLSGEIPAGLFTSDMTLRHLLLDSNQINGSIPDALGLVRTLEVVRLDNNSFSGVVPTSFMNLTRVSMLYLSNNKFTGPMPDLIDMNTLTYVDMSNNSFAPSDIPQWFSSLQNLTTLVMEKTQIRGSLPVALFNLPQLQNVILPNNQLSGTLSLSSSYSSQLELINLRNNSIADFGQRASYITRVILVDNPICDDGGNLKFCIIPEPRNNSYSTPLQNCSPSPCRSGQVLSPTCNCTYPYTGILSFRAPSFSDLGNTNNYVSLQQYLLNLFVSDHQLPVASVSVSNPTKDINSYFQLSLQVFPSDQNYFNRQQIIPLGNVLSYQDFKLPQQFGPFYFIADRYMYFDGNLSTGSKSLNTGIIIGAAIGGSVLLILLVLAGVYASRQRKRADKASTLNNPFASWDPEKNSGGVPQLTGAKSFSFEEVKKYTNNFSEANTIGAGGYGKVYRGTLPDGQLVAIKRAQQGSMQGSLEFKTEIELLSRVHHKNVVKLVGFCFQQGEQMLVYEYISNGTLKDSLSGISGIRLDWMRRLRISLGAAKGLQYLHDLADPPIIHRDIKSNNILLDERLVAKVADFGLSKLAGESEKGHVTTQVKGTMGYLDPEYYMTNQLTEKSDVYSFGVLLLELITARNPIEKGLFIVRLLKQKMDKTKELYNLQEILDPILRTSMPKGSLEKFVDVSLRCVAEEGANRPSMSEVVKEIENIMELSGLNPNAESATTSATYEGAGKDSSHPYNSDSLFAYSGAFTTSNLEPK